MSATTAEIPNVTFRNVYATNNRIPKIAIPDAIPALINSSFPSTGPTLSIRKMVAESEASTRTSFSKRVTFSGGAGFIRTSIDWSCRASTTSNFCDRAIDSIAGAVTSALEVTSNNVPPAQSIDGRKPNNTSDMIPGTRTNAEIRTYNQIYLE